MPAFELTLTEPGDTIVQGAPAAPAVAAMLWASLADGDEYQIPTHLLDEEGNELDPPRIVMTQNNYTRSATLTLAGAPADATIEWLHDAATVLTDFDTITTDSNGPVWQIILSGYGNDNAIVTVTADYEGTVYTAELDVGSGF